MDSQEKNNTTKKYVFESVEKIKKPTADATIYSNGMVRFSNEAVEKYSLREASLLWGECENDNTIVMRKELGGRVLRGEHKDTTSCPLRLAVRHVGRYKIECVGEVMELRPMA